MRAIVNGAARIAARQHGVITAAQLLELGLSRSAIDRWVQKGLLHREYRGVFRLGHRAPSVEARYMGAVLACGDGAALSGPPAAFVYALVQGDPPAPEVSVPALRRVPGIATRRREIPSRIWRGIPTATVPQTVTDLAATLPLDALALVCHRAEIAYGVKNVDGRGRRGAAKLRAIYDGDHALLLSVMEREFRALLRRRGLLLPRFNRKQGTHYVDCRWRGLTVELDSYRFHHSRHAWEQDFERERAARARGDEFRRFTYKDIAEQPESMLADLGRMLSTLVGART
jgi:very-short-patch-repair endonuclease